MTIEDGSDYASAVSESAILVSDSELICFKLINLNRRKIALLTDADNECADGIRTNGSNVKAIDAGRVTVENGRQMIADAVARNERMLEIFREIVTIDEEIISLQKQKLEKSVRLCDIYDDILEYVPRSIEDLQADIIKSSAKLVEYGEERKEIKAKLKQARKSHDIDIIKDCKEDFRINNLQIDAHKRKLKTSRQIVKSRPEAIGRNKSLKEMEIETKEKTERNIIEAEEAKRSDEKRMADIAARIEELKGCCGP